ncbi:MAG TPA: S-methyl-5'-thioadenosine phosphorylase [Nitrososphaeraceae archaeon]
MIKNLKYKSTIGIIGGTGLYDSNIFNITDEIKINTPYGETSDRITICTYNEKKIAFIPRHGKNHRIPPHKVNYQANIWAMKELGVNVILAPSAVGSLQPQYKPGDIVLPHQYIDFTKKRRYTFYDGPVVCHISQSDPFCSDLRQTIIKDLNNLQFKFHPYGTYICIEGPRFSTKAESNYYRTLLKADIIGMTLIPECILAREMEMCYVSISTVTDYDVWAEVSVTSKEIIETLSKNVDKTKKLLLTIIPKIMEERNICNCSNSLENALV